MRDIVDQKPQRKLRGRPFPKGNPGRPRGARNRTTVAYEQLLEGQGEAVVSKVIEMALAGNPMAARLVFERVMGTRRERSVDLALPPLRSTADCATALALVVEAAAAGDITPAESLSFTQSISATMRAFEASEIDQGISALEETLMQTVLGRPNNHEKSNGQR